MGDYLGRGISGEGGRGYKWDFTVSSYVVYFLFYIFFLLQRIFIFIIYSPLYSFNQLEFLFMAILCLSSVLYTVQNDVSCSERTEQHCAQFFLAYTIIISLRTGKALFRILFGQLRWLKDKVL